MQELVGVPRFLSLEQSEQSSSCSQVTRRGVCRHRREYPPIRLVLNVCIVIYYEFVLARTPSNWQVDLKQIDLHARIDEHRFL